MILFSKKKQKVLAIDWDACEVRLVPATVRKGKIRVDDLLYFDVPADVDVSDPLSLGNLIREAIDKKKLRTDCVLLDVPRDQVLLSTLKLPATNPDEMPAMVEFQVAKEIPFPLSDAVVDFAQPDVDDVEGPVDVLVGTVRREVVSYYQDTCQAAGLKLSSLGLRPYANKIAADDLLVDEGRDCVVMVDVGPRLTEIDIIRNGSLAFSRAASVPLPRPQKAEEERIGDETDTEDGSVIPISSPPMGSVDPEMAVNTLLVEITRTIEAYRSSDPGFDVEVVVVGGGMGVEAKLAEAVGRRFGASVQLYDPSLRFGWSEAEGRVARKFSAALGLISAYAAGGYRHFDFLNPKRTVTATERRLKKAPAVITVGVVLFGAAFSYYLMQIRPQKITKDEIKDKITKTNKAIKELKHFKSKVLSELESFESGQIIWLDELERLRGLLPGTKDLLVTRIDMSDKGGRITLKLEAVNSEVVNEAVNRIDAFRIEGQDAPHFNATANALTTKDRGGQYKTTGSIDVVIIDRVEE